MKKIYWYIRLFFQAIYVMITESNISTDNCIWSKGERLKSYQDALQRLSEIKLED